MDLLIATDITGLKFFGLVDRLKTALQKNVDVMTTEQLKENKVLIEEILKNGIKIYG